MGEDSGYFSRRSNEFRLPAHNRYNHGSHCEQKRICCCCNSHDHNGSPRTSYECRNVGSSSNCMNSDTTATTITDSQCCGHHCQCDSSSSSSALNNTNSNNTHVRDRCCCPHHCDHHHHHHHPHYTQNRDPQIKSPYTNCGPDSQLYQQTSNDSHNINNNPSDIISSPSSLSSSPHSTSDRIPHSSSSLAYPGSGGSTANNPSSIGSRSNSGYLCDNNTSSASGVGYQNNNNNNSSSSRVGRARFSPDDLLKLGYEDLQKSPALKRFSHGFEDEEEFEDFKQDLRDFILLKKDPPIVEDSLSSSTHSSSGFSSDPTWSSNRRPYTRDTSSDSDGSTSDDNYTPGSITRRDLTDNNNRDSHHHHHQQQHHHLSPPNYDRSNYCKVETLSCDNNNPNQKGKRREVVRSISFSSRNADKSGRISGRDVVERTNSPQNSSSAYLPKFSPTSSRFSSSSFSEHDNPNRCYSSSPSSSDNNNKHGPVSVKRHSPRNLPSFQHLTPSLRNTSAPHDMLMDFFKSDEHFQEFEREFANLGRDFDVFNRLRRIDDGDEDEHDGRPAATAAAAARGVGGVEQPPSSSSSSGSATPIHIRVDPPRGGGTESPVSSSSGSCTPIPIHVNYRTGGGSREPTPRTELGVRASDSGGDNRVGGFHPDDTFSDFFNNDEDFKEFENVFANFKLKRRSRAFADDFNRRSNCDLFADLFPGFEGQSPRERRSRTSASDWDYLFNKIKRNSNIFPEPSQCPSERDLDEDVFPAHPNDQTTSPAIPQPSYLEHPDVQLRNPRKAVDILIQRRPTLPESPAPRQYSPDVTQSPGLRKKPLEMRIEHVSSPCSSPTYSSNSSPRTPTGQPFFPRPRTESPLLLHINEDELRNNSPPGQSVRRVLSFDDFDEERGDEPTTPTNTDDDRPVLRSDQQHSANNNNNTHDDEEEEGDGPIVIEHRFSEGFSTPTTTIRRRKKGSTSSERSGSPASPLTLRNQNAQYHVASPDTLERRRYTDPSKIVIEHQLRDSEEPESSKQNRFSTALEFLHDVDADKSDKSHAGQHEPHVHDKDCQYTCHEKCRQLVTLDCKNSLPNSGSDGSIETSLSEPASTPGSNSTISDTSPNDETDSGYRSGPIPEEILPKKQPSQATLNREDLKRKLQEYNNNVPFANLAMESDGETFQGFIKVTLNLIRPITMSLGARPPSIYEVLTREHIVEENTQSISFYMPRDTVKSIHVDSETTTKEVISALLKKFKILDNPRKFAMYEQELNLGKIVKLRRVVDAECPLQTCLAWGTENLEDHRLVLQENEATGDIEWSNFSLPELGNFLKVLDREKEEHINQLQYKYRMMKKVILQRLKEIRKCRNDASPTSPSAPTGNGNHSPGGGQTPQKVI